MASREDLALDLEELKELRTIAKRPRSVKLISDEISMLEKSTKEADSAPVPAPAPAPAPISTLSKATPISTAPNAASNSLLNYATLSTFSWDQDSERVKIYIPLEGVDHDKTEADFKKMSIDLKFTDVQGKNYRCAVPKLNREIKPEKCKLTVKTKRVIVTLVKASPGNWSDLHFKEDKLKPSLDKERDPMAGIMDLMKNMYEEGDDDMKKTIAKAWTDARSGKAADPMQNFQ